MTNLILGILAVIGSVWVLYCIATAQKVDENFKPLEPQKTLKDLWYEIVWFWYELNSYVALSLLVIFLGLMGYLLYFIYVNL